MTKLPVFEMVIEESTTSDIGVSFVALVDEPAIEKNFLAFNSLKLDFAADAEKRIISGPAMVADSLIYRRDDNGEYNVFFSKKTVEDIALKFFKMDYQKNLNLFHDPKLSLEGVTIFESFVTDSARGIQPMKGFEDLPEGTWFISCKVENDAVWNAIKAGEVKGFSVEGIFSYMKKPQAIEEQMKALLNRTYNPDGHLPETSIMSVVKDAIKTFKDKFFTPAAPAAPATPVAPVKHEEGGEPEAPVKTDYTLKDGTLVSIDKLEEGGVVLMGEVPAAPGDYELTDGTKFTVGEGGVITAVTPAEPAAPADPAQPAAPADDPMQRTPEQLMASVKEAVHKFASGTPEERLANLELIAKALMEYNFGWDIRRQQEEADRAAAINIYKTGLESQKTELEKANTTFAAAKSEYDLKLKDAADKLEAANKVINTQNEKIDGLFKIIEQLGDMPAGEGVPDNKTSFSSDKAQRKEAKLKALSDSLANLKKFKTA